MDASRLDDLHRSLAEASSRRGIARALAGLGFGGMIGPLLGLASAEAKKGQKKKSADSADGGESRRTARSMVMHGAGPSRQSP